MTRNGAKPGSRPRSPKPHSPFCPIQATSAFSEPSGGIAVDSNGAAYVTGSTDSTNFPTQDAFQSDQGDRDVFVTMLELEPEAEPPAPAPAADTTAPETTITKGPKDRIRKKKATFEFASSEPGSSFQCKLDKGGFETCSSPQTVRAKKGKHHFEVRAIDAAGNVDASPAADDWKRRR